MTEACTAYQYRLTGPNAWTGARDAILSQQERILYPFKRPLLDDNASIDLENSSSAKNMARKIPTYGKFWKTILLSSAIPIAVALVFRRGEQLKQAFKTALLKLGTPL